MLWLILMPALLVVAALSLPAGIAFERRAGESRRRLIVCGVRLPARATSRDSEEQTGRGAQAKIARRIPGLARLLATETDAHDVEAVIRAVRGLGKSVRVRVRRLDLMVATPDYALTGALYGFACAGLGSLNRRIPISCAADFTRTRPDAGYRLDVTARPMELIYLGMRTFGQLVLRKPRRAVQVLSLWRRKERTK